MIVTSARTVDACADAGANINWRAVCFYAIGPRERHDGRAVAPIHHITCAVWSPGRPSDERTLSCRTPRGTRGCCISRILQELILVSSMPPAVSQQPGKMSVFVQTHGFGPRTCHNDVLKSWEHSTCPPDMQAERAEGMQAATRGIWLTRTSSHREGTAAHIVECVYTTCTYGSEGHFAPPDIFTGFHTCQTHRYNVKLPIRTIYTT